jgi:hypothetical protein
VPVVWRENLSSALGAVGRGVCAAIDDTTGARSSRIHPPAIRLGATGSRLGLVRGPGADDRRGSENSGASAEDHHGFQRLVAEVGLDHVGLILGVEMSRLARSFKDWHQLLEICALCGTLIADLNGIYDPSQYNDCLSLGLKRHHE